MRSLIAALSLCVGLVFGVAANAEAREVGDQYDLYVRHPVVAAKGKAARSVSLSFGSLESRARQYMGASARDLGLPGRAWCADFMNKITGGGTGSRLARSYASYGSRASYGCTGCIAVLTRGRSRRSGHVGIVTGYDGHGDPIIVSGNHNRRVGEGVYSKHRVIAWRQV